MVKYSRVAPLSAGFLLVGMLGFVISIMFVFPKNPPWGFTLAVLSAIMFIASMISMTYAPEKMEEEIDKLEQGIRKPKIEPTNRKK